jgi:hypothetical protein
VSKLTDYDKLKNVLDEICCKHQPRDSWPGYSMQEIKENTDKHICITEDDADVMFVFNKFGNLIYVENQRMSDDEPNTLKQVFARMWPHQTIAEAFTEWAKKYYYTNIHKSHMDLKGGSMGFNKVELISPTTARIHYVLYAGDMEFDNYKDVEYTDDLENNYAE